MPLRTLLRPAERAASIAFFASLVGASCGQEALGLLPGVVNDPGNLSLRRAVLHFGTGRMCTEMMKRSMPLRLRAEDPAIGRFFATQCSAQEPGDGQVTVQFSGFGYVWTNVTGRITFDAAGGVTYDTDFSMDGSTMYVYFREKQSTPVKFQTRVVERPAAALAMALPLGASGAELGNTVGSQIVAAEIKKGFTVVRGSNGSAEFGLGMVEKGRHPSLVPYRVTDSGKPILANDRSELHQDQRDFVGPFEVTADAKLVINVAVDGAPAIDVLLFPRGPGEVWLQQYALQARPTTPPSPPVLDEPVTAGGVFKRTVAVPPGLYYLVLDNTATAGRTQPTSYAHDDRAALVSYGLALDP